MKPCLGNIRRVANVMEPSGSDEHIRIWHRPRNSVGLGRHSLDMNPSTRQNRRQLLGSDSSSHRNSIVHKSRLTRPSSQRDHAVLWRTLRNPEPVGLPRSCSNFLYVFKAARNGPLTPSPRAAHRRPRGNLLIIFRTGKATPGRLVVAAGFYVLFAASLAVTLN
jgi:hypothetical protein